MNTCTVRCYGCDWTVTVVGMEAAQDAMSDHYKAKHWTPIEEESRGEVHRR